MLLKACQITSTSVSYTHLDVYKRQGKATVKLEIIDKNNKVALTEENADELIAILNEW